MNVAKCKTVVAYTHAFLVFKCPGACPEKEVEACATTKQTCNDLCVKCACEVQNEMEDSN